jgi:PAS domain S-box-containing protein
MSSEFEQAGETYQLLDRLPIAALIVNDHGRYVYANAAACELLGRSPSEILGRSIRDVATDDFDFDSAWLQFTADGAQVGDFLVQRPGGTVIPVHFQAVRDFAPGNHISVLNDVTERRRIEADLRRSEELYARVFNRTPAPTNVRRLKDGAFIDVNEAFIEATGYWRSEVLGRTGARLGLWTDPSLLESLLERLREGEETVRTRAELRMKDHSTKEFSVAFRRVDIYEEPHVIALYTDLASL